ncbi:MAG TPA: Clp protease N-terminal domain-containing protein, partial [Allocoleopsis sp.]
MFGNIFNKKTEENQQPSGAPVSDQNTAAAPGQPTPADPSMSSQQGVSGAPQDPGQTQSPGVQDPSQSQTGQPSGYGQDASGNPVANPDGTPVEQNQQGAGQPGQDGSTPSSGVSADGSSADPNAAPGADPSTGSPQQGAGQDQQAAAEGGNPALRADTSALSHLDPRATQVLTHAQEETRRIKQQYIEPDQLLIGLLYDQQLYKFLEESGVDGGKLSKDIQA